MAGLKANADGSVTFWFGPKAPAVRKATGCRPCLAKAGTRYSASGPKFGRSAMRHNAAFPQGLSIHQKRTSLALRHTQPTSVGYPHRRALAVAGQTALRCPTQLPEDWRTDDCGWQVCCAEPVGRSTASSTEALSLHVPIVIMATSTGPHAVSRIFPTAYGTV